MNDRNVATLNLEGVRPFADRNLPNTADQRIPDDFLLPTRFRGRRDELDRIGFLGFLINLIEVLSSLSVAMVTFIYRLFL